MDRWTGLEAGTQSTSESTIFLFSLVSLISSSKDVNSYSDFRPKRRPETSHNGETVNGRASSEGPSPVTVHRSTSREPSFRHKRPLTSCFPSQAASEGHLLDRGR